MRASNRATMNMCGTVRPHTIARPSHKALPAVKTGSTKEMAMTRISTKPISEGAPPLDTEAIERHEMVP